MRISQVGKGLKKQEEKGGSDTRYLEGHCMALGSLYICIHIQKENK